MADSINHITGICGAGKSHKMLSLIAAQQEVEPRVIIFASKTIRLSTSNFIKYKALGHNCIQLDGENRLSDHVIVDIVNAVVNTDSIVVFTTHKSALNIPKAWLKNVHVVFDEVPQDATKFLNVSLSEASSPLIQVCEFSSTPNHNYGTVRLKAEYRDTNHTNYNPMIKHLVDGAKNGTITENTEDYINVLEFLLMDYAVLYKSQTVENIGIVYQLYAVHYMPAINVIESAQSVTVLAANLNNSAFAFIVKNVLNIQINEVSTLNLPIKYRKKLTVIPYLVQGRISASIKGLLCSQALTDKTFSTLTVVEDMQAFTSSLLDSDYLLFKNNKDKVINIDSGVAVLSTAVHGLNSYMDYTKASFIASLRPTTVESNIQRCMALDLNLNPAEFNQTVVIERCYESALQCIMRMGIRKLYNDLGEPVEDNTEYVCVVPDMDYANYIAAQFDDGFCTIDTSHGYKRKDNVEVETTKAAAKDNRLQTVTNILLDKKNKVAAMPELFTKHGITKPTFDRYKREFKSELQSLGLIKVSK